ncbi:hypothetical protein H0H92_012589, partial [Tricholoma furcatifolium]
IGYMICPVLKEKERQMFHGVFTRRLLLLQNLLNAKRDAELRSKFIIVPSGAEAKQFSCPICKETSKPEFSDEEEDWVWRNAVTVDER